MTEKVKLPDELVKKTTRTDAKGGNLSTSKRKKFLSTIKAIYIAERLSEVFGVGKVGFPNGSY